MSDWYPISAFKRRAIEALQQTSEAFLVELFEDTQLAALHANIKFVMRKNIHLAVRMMEVDKTILAGYKNGDYARRI